ncbi:MAG TPA: sigma-70 family RNA polymerase sigma factor [Kofleriaceae bacterium]|nr:sigma-70 family RNA polymerase sigma factor [Kofleriaceae bacterium]
MTTQLAPRGTDDAELIARVLAGSRDDFELIVRRHNQRLFRAARAVLRSETDAEDALQQAWLEIYRNLGSFRGDAAFTTWATRITVNAALSHARKRPALTEATAVETGAGPDADLERVEMGRVLEGCLEQLPQGNREVMVLRDVLELDTAETASLLGLTEEAVRVRLHRARAAVAAALTELTLDHVYEFDGARCARVTCYVMAAIPR